MYSNSHQMVAGRASIDFQDKHISLNGHFRACWVLMSDSPPPLILSKTSTNHREATRSRRRRQ